MARRRADLLIVEQGLAESRTRAQALILAGAVIAGDSQRVDKPGELFAEQTIFRLKEQPLPYVSRGGLKLEAALDAFAIDPAGRVGLDVGASTGGFTDCLLQRGATRIYAVDVGTNQLAWKLRSDERVVVIEKTNIRTIDPTLIPEACGIIVLDVSFISLELALPPALRFAEVGAAVVALVKPQFEAGRGEVGKGGIVRDPEVRQRTLEKVESLYERLGLSERRSIESPIEGAKGNREYLLCGTVTRLPAATEA